MICVNIIPVSRLHTVTVDRVMLTLVLQMAEFISVGHYMYIYSFSGDPDKDGVLISSDSVLVYFVVDKDNYSVHIRAQNLIISACRSSVSFRLNVAYNE